MTKLRALASSQETVSAAQDMARAAIAIGCALALILAGPVLPF